MIRRLAPHPQDRERFLAVVREATAKLWLTGTRGLRPAFMLRKQPWSQPPMPAKSQKKRSSKAKVTRSQDAIALLRADHAVVEDLFEQFEKARDERRKKTLAERICMELKIHTAIEEEIFYPATREVLPKSEDLLDEAKVEHDSAKELIAQIEKGQPSDDLWEAKVTVLGEYIKHHVKEEHTEMFPKVRKTKLDLRALGEQLRQRKEQLQSKASTPA